MTSSMLVASSPGSAITPEQAAVCAGTVSRSAEWRQHFIDAGSTCDEDGPDNGGGSGADGVDAMDFDGDCDVDVVTGWEESGKVFVYLNPTIPSNTPSEIDCTTLRPTLGSPGSEAPARVTDQWEAIEITRQDEPNRKEPFAGVEDAVFADNDGDDVADYVVIATEKGTLNTFVSVPWYRVGVGWRWTTAKLPGEEYYMRARVGQIDGRDCPDLLLGSKTVESSPGIPAKTGDIRWWACSPDWKPEVWKYEPGAARPVTEKQMIEMWGNHNVMASDIYWVMEMDIVDIDGDTTSGVANEVLFTDRKKLGYMDFTGGVFDVTSKEKWNSVIIDNPSGSDEPFRWYQYGQLVPGGAQEIVVATNGNEGRGVFANWYSFTPSRYQGDKPRWDRYEIVIEGGEIPWPKFGARTNKAAGIADLDGDGVPEVIGTVRAKETSGVFSLTPPDGTAPMCSRSLGEDCSGEQQWAISYIAPWYTDGEIKYDNLGLFDVDRDCDIDIVTVEENGVGDKGLGTVWYENLLEQGPFEQGKVIEACNRPPVITTQPESVTIDEGDTATVRITVSDPDGSPVELTTTRSTLTPEADGSWTWRRRYNDGPAVRTVRFTATDDEGATSTHELSVTVNNVAPTVGPVDVPASVRVGEPVTVGAPFTDPATGGSESYTCEVDWGTGEGPQPGETSISGGVRSCAATNAAGYVEPGVYSVSVVVYDGHENSLVETAELTVLPPPVPPTLVAPKSITIDEGDTAMIEISATDPDGTAVTVVATSGSVVQLGAPDTWMWQQTYVDGPFSETVTFTATDGDQQTADHELEVTVNNVAPTVKSVDLPASVRVGQIVTVDAPFTDPAAGLESYSCLVDWGDGGPERPGVISVVGAVRSCRATDVDGYDSPGLYTVSVVVNDGDDSSAVAEADVRVLAPPELTAPTSITVDEGDAATVEVTIFDVDGTIVSAAASTGSLTPDGTSDTWTWTKRYAEGPFQETVTFTATDDDDLTSTHTLDVTVDNVAPSVDATGTTIDEGGTATVSLVISDPGTEDAFVVEVDWGEGPAETFDLPAGKTVHHITHVYLDDDPSGTPSDTYDVAVTVTDDDDGVGEAAATVTVNNVAPVATFDRITDVLGNEIGNDPGQLAVVLAGSPVTLHASFTDVGTRDSHEAVIDWGDGLVESLATSGTVSATHNYVVPGSYEVRVDVADDDGGGSTVGRVVDVVDAEGALGGVIVQTRAALDGGGLAPAVRAALRDALVALEGHADGRGSDGAVDKLGPPATNALVVKINRAIAGLHSAGWHAEESLLGLVVASIDPALAVRIDIEPHPQV